MSLQSSTALSAQSILARIDWAVGRLPEEDIISYLHMHANSRELTLQRTPDRDFIIMTKHYSRVMETCGWRERNGAGLVPRVRTIFSPVPRFRRRRYLDYAINNPSPMS